VFAAVFLPVYRRMVAALKAAGAPRVLLHCDGNLAPLLDLLVEAGFDGINPVEYGAGMDVAELLPRYWGRLSFVGGVCNTHILPGGDPGAIRRHIERLVDAGRDGGLVMGTHSIGPDISVDSYELYRRVVLERGSGIGA
jgi:uroporphyrinogen decarboxylase